MLYKKSTPYLYLVPVVAMFLLFFAYPFVNAIYYSFTKWNMYSPPEWIGFQNYQTILFNSESIYYKTFWRGMFNTLKFVLFSVPPLVIVPFLLAVLLSYKTRGYKVFQGVFYIPSLFSVATVALMWLWILDGKFGAVNRLIGMEIPWSAKQPFVWIALVVMTVWWTIGGNMVIYSAGINDISPSLFEAASIDGASELRKLIHITVPSLKNQFAYTFVLTTIASFNVFGQPLMFSKGGPAESTKSIIMYIREYAFSPSPKAGIAVSMSVVLGVIICGFSILQYILLSRASD